eukprot:scaffold7382_cov406-Prasinococcus_capsulatus_cf.AAC.2
MGHGVQSPWTDLSSVRNGVGPLASSARDYAVARYTSLAELQNVKDATTRGNILFRVQHNPERVL